jgi:hypothetical protein
VKLSAAAQRPILARVRKICLALPDTSERPSHGEPTFFVKDRSFATMDTYHHGAAHYAVHVAAPLGAQDVLTKSDPARFFVPPYVGVRGWVGVVLDNDPDWDEIQRLLVDGHAFVLAARKR